MFIKLTRSGARTYAQLVESFRDEYGKPRQRTVATLGRIDEHDGQVDALLNGLLRAKGRPVASSGNPQVRFESALSLGAYFSDRGRLFQADRGRRIGAAVAALGKHAGTGLTVADSSTISLKRTAVVRVSGPGLNPI